MKKLLVITQKVDENDDLLGFFVDWIGELAKHFVTIDVICLGVGEYKLPDNVNVYSLGKERGSSKISRAIVLIKLLSKLMEGKSAVFAHMSPIFAIASWPFAVLRGVPVILWYLHRSDTFKLRVAKLLSKKIITADKDSLTISGEKIIAIGHGIDCDKFFSKRSWNKPATVVDFISVGRISPIKDHATLIRAFSGVLNSGHKAHLRIVGRSVMPGDEEYHNSLIELMQELGCADGIDFKGLVPYIEIPMYYSGSHYAVSMAPTGGIDKTILEAMASGCIVFTSNNVMRKYLGKYADLLIFEHGNWQELLAKITHMLSLDGAKKQEISDYMVKSVSSNHSLKVLASKISSLI